MYPNKTSMLQLLPHNKRALELCKDTWSNGWNRVCVVHPTGTGKSFIYHRLVQDEPNWRILVVAPRHDIFTTQRAAILRACPDYDFQCAYDTTTYVNLLNMSKRGDITPDAYDCIILDECHRALAPTWQFGVKDLLAANPGAKVLGLTATPIRYNDNGRDVTQILFDGMVASHIDVLDAIEDGILPAPKYIVGDYDPIARLASYQRRVAKLRGKRRADANAVISSMKRAATTSAANIADILEKNLDDPCGKYILFFPKIAELEHATSLLPQWFSQVNKDLHVYSVHSKSHKSNRDQLAAFDSDEDPFACKLMLSVDMLSEGVHPHHLNGIIMLRHTDSPNIYLQQIGRALDIANVNHVPVIVDLVDNIDDVTLAFKSCSNSDSKIGRGTALEKVPFFHIVDSALARQQLYDKLDRILEPLTINDMIDLLVADYEARQALKTAKKGVA